MLIFDSCVYQQNFLNCLAFYEHQIDAYTTIKKYWEDKKESGECGTVVEGIFIIDNTFFTQQYRDEDESEDRENQEGDEEKDAADVEDREN